MIKIDNSLQWKEIEKLSQKLQSTSLTNKPPQKDESADDYQDALIEKLSQQTPPPPTETDPFEDFTPPPKTLQNPIFLPGSQTAVKKIQDSKPKFFNNSNG